MPIFDRPSTAITSTVSFIFQNVFWEDCSLLLRHAAWDAHYRIRRTDGPWQNLSNEKRWILIFASKLYQHFQTVHNPSAHTSPKSAVQRLTCCAHDCHKWGVWWAAPVHSIQTDTTCVCALIRCNTTANTVCSSMSCIFSVTDGEFLQPDEEVSPVEPAEWTQLWDQMNDLLEQNKWCVSTAAYLSDTCINTVGINGVTNISNE